MKQLLNKTLLLFVLLLLALAHSFAQTLSLKAQARAIIARLKSNYEYPVDAKDTLIDLNRDGFKDLLIEYYGLAGTGLKNRITVYLYDNSKKKLKQCEQLNSLANPTFYFDKKIVVGYYLGNGSGGATKFKWKDLRLDRLEHIDIDVVYKGSDIRCFKLTSFNYITKKRTFKTLQMMKLPDEYRYMDYEPIIKKNSR